MLSELLYEYHWQVKKGRLYCPECLQMVEVREDTESCADCGARVRDLGYLQQDCIPVGTSPHMKHHYRLMYRAGGMMDEPLDEIDEFFDNMQAAKNYASLRACWFPAQALEIQCWRDDGSSWDVRVVPWSPKELFGYHVHAIIDEKIVWTVRTIAYNEDDAKNHAVMAMLGKVSDDATLEVVQTG